MNDYFNEMNEIQMNPRHDEYMDIDNYDSLAKSQKLEFGSIEAPKKKETKKKLGFSSSSFLKTDLVATLALVTAVVGPSIISDNFEDLFSPISAEFVETITDINEIDYYLSIDSLEKTLGDVELRISGPNYNATTHVKEGKNIGEITGLEENNNYVIALYDGGYLVKKTEVKTLTEEEKIERAWRKFFPNFLDINYDKESDLFNFKMKVVDDLNSYEFLVVSIVDENENETFMEFSAEERNYRHSIPLREQGIYGKDLSITVIGYLKMTEELDVMMEEEILYEGLFTLDEAVEMPEIISPVGAILKNSIVDINTIDYYISIENVEEAFGEIYLEVTSGDYYNRFTLFEGDNKNQLTDLESDNYYLFNIYDNGYLVDSFELKTLTEEEKEARAWRKYFEDFSTLYFDEEDEVLFFSFRIVDDLYAYNYLGLSIYDEYESGTYLELSNEEGSINTIPIRECEIYGKELYITLHGYLVDQAMTGADSGEEVIFETTMILPKEGDRPEVSEVYSYLNNYIADISSIDFLVTIEGIDRAKGEVYIELSTVDEVINRYYLDEGRNIDSFENLESDTEYNFYIYDGDYLIDSYYIKTLSEEELSNRQETKFYEDFLRINYSNNNIELKMKLIDDKETYIGFRILAENGVDESSVEISMEDINNTQIITFGKVSEDNTVTIILYGMINSSTEMIEEMIFKVTYNIEEGTYTYEEKD